MRGLFFFPWNDWFSFLPIKYFSIIRILFHASSILALGTNISRRYCREISFLYNISINPSFSESTNIYRKIGLFRIHFFGYAFHSHCKNIIIKILWNGKYLIVIPNKIENSLNHYTELHWPKLSSDNQESF